MKIKFLQLITAFFAVAFLTTSCLDSQETTIEIRPESSIQSFSIGTLNITRVGKDVNGNDSTFRDTIDCSKYPFTIDQLNRTIENKDSLPFGADATKVPVKLSSTGYMVAYEKLSDGEYKDTVWTETDSINFTLPYTAGGITKGVRFKVWNPEYNFGKPYIVKVNVHQQVPDTLEWTSLPASFAGGIITRQKAIYHNEQIYVFGEQDGKSVMTSIHVNKGQAGTWSTPVVLEGINPVSATLWNGQLYILKGNDLCLLQADGSLQPIGSTMQLTALLSGAHAEKLYAVNTDNVCVASADGITWSTESGNVSLPSSAIYSFTHSYEHNPKLTGITFIGHNPVPGDSTAIVYGRLANEDGWTYYEQGEERGCPNMENLTVVQYDNKLIAIGGGLTIDGKEKVAPFSVLYESVDHGVSWQKMSQSYRFPKENAEKGIKTFATKYTEHHKNYSCVTGENDKENNFIWIVWEDGSLERGLINRLHFKDKW